MAKVQVEETATEEAKGTKGGRCNREDCQKQKATYYNHSTRFWYCKTCAMKINSLNKAEAVSMFGHDLCTKEGLGC